MLYRGTGIFPTDTSPTPQSSTMLHLPNEILLQVALHMPKSVKLPDPQRDLVNLALTCKQLRPIAREALCHEPILQSSKTHLLLETLFRYPGLRSKARSLTIETKGTRGRKVLPTSIPALEVGFLQNCIRQIQALPIDQETKDWWIADLKAKTFKFSGPLLCILLTMLPHLKGLYLGGSVLFHLPLFRNILPILDDDAYLNSTSRTTQISNWDFPNLSCTMTLLGPKLMVLELPNDFRLSADAQALQVAEVRGISKYFPELRQLMLPSSAVIEAPCQDIVPSKLEALILTDARLYEVDDWIVALVRSKKQHFRDLRKVALYYRHKEQPAEQPFLQFMIKAGVKYSEYIPGCCFGSGNEFYHPWMYTPAELARLEQDRHDEYEREME